jgi:hypothetical protein
MKRWPPRFPALGLRREQSFCSSTYTTDITDTEILSLKAEAYTNHQRTGMIPSRLAINIIPQARSGTIRGVPE